MGPFESSEIFTVVKNSGEIRGEEQGDRVGGSCPHRSPYHQSSAPRLATGQIRLRPSPSRTRKCKQVVGRHPVPILRVSRRTGVLTTASNVRNTTRRLSGGSDTGATGAPLRTGTDKQHGLHPSRSETLSTLRSTLRGVDRTRECTLTLRRPCTGTFNVLTPY